MTSHRACAACGAPLPGYPGRGRPRRYCGDACRWRAGHAAARDRARAAEPQTLGELLDGLRSHPLAGPG